VPRVQVALDGSTSWQDAWSRTPTADDAQLDAAWVPVTVPLVAWAGRAIRLRFLYDYSGGTAFTLADQGWYFDDVALIDADQVGATSDHVVATPSFPFTPTTVARSVLRVRPRCYGAYDLDWGPPTVVEATLAAPASK
jgi:hypothetical protein